MSFNVRWVWVILLAVPLLASCSNLSRLEKSGACMRADAGAPHKKVKAQRCSAGLSDSPFEAALCSLSYYGSKLTGGKLSSDKSGPACNLNDLYTGKKNPKAPDLQFPIDGGVLSSGFGYRRGVFHSGLDIAACKGEPIHACADGQVLFTGSRKGYRSYGQAVMIDHGDDCMTHYAHLSRILVRKGKKVAAGDVIGLVGSTGRSTSPHLHLEVRVGSQLYNPMAYFAPGEVKKVDIARSFTDTPMGPVRARKRLSARP